MVDADSISDRFLDFLLAESDQYVAAAIPDHHGAVAIPDDHDPSVPTHMILGASLLAESTRLVRSPLEKIVFGQVVADIHTSSRKTITLAKIMRRQRNHCPTVCLVMRRPGCPFCREDALELSRWFHRQHDTTEPFHLMGIVKDASDVDGLHELFTKYFAHPIYRDVGLETFRGLGWRTISWRQWLNLPAGTLRVRAKNITYNLEGTSDTIQGGVLIFDGSGTLRYAYREIYADQLVLDDIRAAVVSVQRQTTTTTNT
jgi:hypothetical protein